MTDYRTQQQSKGIYSIFLREGDGYAHAHVGSIYDLRSEANEAGDRDMAKRCTQALAGNKRAVKDCLDIIADAAQVFFDDACSNHGRDR